MNDFEDIELTEDSESDYIIDPITGKETSLAYGLYRKLIDYEYHYNNVQTKYKSLALSWFLATCLGIGYLLSGFETKLPFDFLLAIFMLCLFSAEGIYLLGFLDIAVYQVILTSVFVESLKIESHYPSVGYARHNILRVFGNKKRPSKKRKDPVIFHSLYYASFIVFLLIASATSIFLFLYKLSTTYAFITFSFALSSILFFLLFHFKKTCKLGVFYLFKKTAFKIDKRFFQKK